MSVTTDRIRAARVVPVLRSASAEAAVADIDTLQQAGLSVVELTTSTPDWADALREAGTRWPQLCLGVGTVTTEPDAHLAAAGGAGFLVSPYPAPAVRPVAEAAGLEFLEGGLTPGEVAAAAGRGVAKLFPAHVGGPQYLKSLLAVLPGARIMPTGGIKLTDVRTWLDAGAFAVGVGSDLLSEPDLPGRLAAALGNAASGS